MKGLIFLLASLAVLAVTQSEVFKAPDSRASVNWGTVNVGDTLLSRTNLSKPPMLNAIQTQDFIYPGNRTTRIRAVQATEVGGTQYASARIVAGGVGYNTVTVRITSARGRGFNYQISVWGQGR